MSEISCKVTVTVCVSLFYVIHLVQQACRRAFVLCGGVFHGNEGIRQALRRCQQYARRPSRRSSPRFPSLLLQCRQCRTRGWGWLLFFFFSVNCFLFLDVLFFSHFSLFFRRLDSSSVRRLSRKERAWSSCSKTDWGVDYIKQRNTVEPLSIT